MLLLYLVATKSGQVSVMWEFDANDVMSIGRTSGGDRFTKFVDQILRIHCFFCGIQDASVQTNLMVCKPDGGVDTQIDDGSSIDHTGRMSTKTIWQYKATDWPKYDHQIKKLFKDEVNKPHAKDCINNGYAYRFCICDEKTSYKKADITNWLHEAVKKINPAAPDSLVLTAGDLAAWGSRYPSLRLQYHPGSLSQSYQCFDAWEKNICALTHLFVQVPTWSNTQRKLQNHLAFSVGPPEVVFTINGKPGVGKTRCVFQTIKDIGNASPLIVYTDDEVSAHRLAMSLANDPKKRAIIIADECSLEYRFRLEDCLRGHKERIRVVAIDNSSKQSSSMAPQVSVEKMPSGIVAKVLDANFTHIPKETRNQYASFAKGYVRLAAFLCNNYQPGETLSVQADSLNEYLERRIPNEQMDCIEALSLFKKIGYKSDVSHELQELCRFMKLDIQKTIQIANLVHDASGFIGRGGRYYYITPEIVAHCTFTRAWKRFVAHDVDAFLKSIPPCLMPAFEERVGASGDENIRQQVSNFFLAWTSSLTPSDLTNIQTVDRLLNIIKISPISTLPKLRKLIETSSVQQIEAISGNSHSGRWGARREIIWLLEGLIRLPELFEDAEYILFRLAQSENEPKIGNNATAIWCQLFRVLLSGTSLHYKKRLSTLERRIRTAKTAQDIELTMKAIENAYSTNHMRKSQPSIILGKATPKEWNPTRLEYLECIEAVSQLLCTLAKKEHIYPYAVDLIIKHLYHFVELGKLSDVQQVFAIKRIADDTRVQLISSIENILHHHIDEDHEAVEELEAWLDTLGGEDPHSKVVTLVGVDPWHHGTLNKENEWIDKLSTLASELIANPLLLEAELDWLLSDNAQSASVLGYQLGQQDAKLLLADTILEHCLDATSKELATGYIRGQVRTFPHSHSPLNNLIDSIERSRPRIACELALAGGEPLHTFDRIVSQVKQGTLKAHVLSSFNFGIETPSGKRRLNNEELIEIVQCFDRAIRGNDKSPILLKTAFRFITFRLHEEEREKVESSLLSDVVMSFSLLLLKEALERPNVDTWDWNFLLKTVSKFRLTSAIEIAIAALTKEHFWDKNVVGFLAEQAKSTPELILEHFGNAALNNDNRLYFHFREYAPILESIPCELSIAWIKDNGVQAAIALARHLPKPIVLNSKPHVPELTAFVLTEFENNDRVFREFCAGVGTSFVLEPVSEKIYLQKAEKAKLFLTSDIKRIREWAEGEIKSNLRSAEFEKQSEEEDDIY